VSTARERLLAAEAAARRLDSAGSEPDGIAPPAKRHVRTDPVRCTADMPPARHAKWLARLDEASIELGMQPGRRGVTSNAGLLALVELLETDETVRRRWIALMAEQNRGAGRRGSIRTA
jgi:hypothetical protein